MDLTRADPLRDNPHYDKISDLNSGSFGFVHLYRHNPTGESVAVKFIERSQVVMKKNGKMYAEDEILNHRQLRHAHVIEFKEVFLTPIYICIVMEYASAGTLFNYVQKANRLREGAARWFFQQLVIGLDYCHRRGVANRDIKLENILLQMEEGLPLPLVKICDFGYSKAMDVSDPKSKVGTLAYMAPEVIKATTFKYDAKMADIWSCGVVLYVMLFGRYPFDVSSQGTPQQVQVVINRILGMQWTIPSSAKITPECRDLLERLLVGEPTSRITMEGILAHPWFRTNLPPAAMDMNNEACEGDGDLPGIQSKEAILQILADARVPAPGIHYGAPSNSSSEIALIDSMIEDDKQMHNASFVPQ